MKTGTIYTASCSPLEDNIQKLLDTSALTRQLGDTQTILLKPNLVDDLPPPITTPVPLIAAIIDYLQARSSCRIIIGEGTASAAHDTFHIFNQLGYTAMAAEKGVELMDLNLEESVCRRRDDCKRWPEMHLPKICFESFLFSVPVLKAHTLADVTLSLKNMMGLAPPRHYQGGNSWKKATFHQQIGQAVADLNRYRSPDFTLLDASVGMAESHLGGATCNPPIGLLVAGFDSVAIDAYGTQLLGKSWHEIEYIRSLNGEIGQAEPLTVINSTRH
jgi:uncharacterized protein (DUF362 family)